MRWLLLATLFLSQPLLADLKGDENTALVPASATYLLKLTGGLTLVVITIFAVGWLLKKSNLAHQNNNGLIRIVAALPMGTRDRIVLVQIGEEQILLGLTPGRISKLHSLSEPLEVAAENSVTASFADRINRLMTERSSS